MISNKNWFKQLELRRQQLGMSKKIVAKRSGVSLPTVNRILSGKETRPTFPNVQAIAAALGVELQLGPIQNVHDFRKGQARAKATRLVRMIQGTMGLEAQAVDPQAIDQMIEQTVCELLAGSQRKLWGD
jgi:transcriptional regulator with XRE-family HTH domain